MSASGCCSKWSASSASSSAIWPVELADDPHCGLGGGGEGSATARRGRPAAGCAGRSGFRRLAVSRLRCRPARFERGPRALSDSPAACSGVGARPSTARQSRSARSSKASSAAGKYSRSALRSWLVWRVRAQIRFWCPRARTLTASASAAVSGDRPVVVAVGADQVGQHLGVAGVGLGPGDVVAVAVAGHRQRVDGVHLIARRGQRVHPQAPVGLDADHHLAGFVGVTRPTARAAGRCPPIPRGVAGPPAARRPRPSRWTSWWASAQSSPTKIICRVLLAPLSLAPSRARGHPAAT